MESEMCCICLWLKIKDTQIGLLRMIEFTLNVVLNTCTQTDIEIHVYNAYTQTQIHIYNAYTQTHIHVYNAYTQTHIHVYNAYTQTQTHVYNAYTQTQIHAYTYTQTHIDMP